MSCAFSFKNLCKDKMLHGYESGIKNAASISIHFDNFADMKKAFTLFFLILLLLAGARQALAENPTTYPGKLDVKFTQILSADFKDLYHPIDTFNRVTQVWKLHLDPNKDIENQHRTGTKPILHLGSIPEILLKYQSDTVFQWGYTLRDLILLLRVAVKAEALDSFDFRAQREANYLLNLNLNFNFLIDFWF